MKTTIIALLIGLVMGVLIQRVRASNPSVIAKNLRLEEFSIIKFMATSIAVGTVLVYLISLIAPVHFSVKPTYLVGVLLGGLVFGAGFGLGGYCPGTCVVGAGEGRKDALWTILGGLLGALVFTLVYATLILPVNRLMNFGKITLAGLLHAPGWIVALVLALILMVIVILLPDRVTPSKEA
jgi:uncharacterized protein